MISFNELIDQLDIFKESLETDIVFDPSNIQKTAEESFIKHLYCTKSWFLRSSWANKKRFLLTLLDNVRSAWTLSLILKAIWNCRTKDAVMSAKDFIPWSSYDQVPLDHNRTAAPLKTLIAVMKQDRLWFKGLDLESQATVIMELLSISGGPITREILHRAQDIYESSRCQLVEMIHKFGPPEPIVEKGAAEKGEPYLVNWNTTVRTMRNNLKMEEYDMTFEGTKMRLWKMNRLRPEAIETIDFIQLLPASLGKRILSYLPKVNLGDYARVNKYWAFLIDELKAEVVARLKIQNELEKLQEVIKRYEDSQEPPALDQGYEIDKTKALVGQSIPKEKFAPYPVRLKSVPITRPVCNMSELTERCERRGAADISLFKWCAALISQRRRRREDINLKYKTCCGGLLPLGSPHFPCPLLKRFHCTDVPLRPPLTKEPVTKRRQNVEQNIAIAMIEEKILSENDQDEAKHHYKLWDRDLSSLMPVLKVAAHQL